MDQSMDLLINHLIEFVYDLQIENYRELEDAVREAEIVEWTLQTIRQLYMENPDAYNGMFDGNRQARMKREGK